MHACPDSPIAADSEFSAAESRSASANTSRADFPPSSYPAGVRFGAAADWIRRAVPPLPVKKILSTPGWLTSALPPTGPPGTTLTTPGGNPTSVAICPSRRHVYGASSGGLITIVFPAASAGASVCPNDTNGPFHGTITAITPNGSSSV
jgi:hypothetical protein